MVWFDKRYLELLSNLIVKYLLEKKKKKKKSRISLGLCLAMCQPYTECTLTVTSEIKCLK